MATSGRIETSRANNTNFYVQWQLAGQSVSGNYSDVNWQAGINMSANTYWYSNAIRIDDGHVNGAGIGNGTWSNINGTGDKQLRSGTVRIYHNADGSKWFDAYINGWLYGNGNRSTSGGWDLPTIPRASQPSVNSWPNNSPNVNVPSTVTIHTNRASSGFTHNAVINAGSFSKNLGGGIASNVTWAMTEADIAAITAAMPNAMSLNGTVTLTTWNGGTWIGEKTAPITFNIPAGTVSPIFTDFEYQDTNATTAGVTGDNQVLVQGKSTVRARVTVANKMTPQRSATATNYTASIDGSTDTQPFSSSANVDLTLASPAGSGAKTLAVTARDSRNQTTTVNKSVTVLPYAPPVVNATASRLNNFENATTLEISGEFSRLTIGSTDKNSITTGTLQYRTRQDGGTWNAWVTKAFTAGVGSFDTTDTNLSLVNSSTWDIEIKVSDKLETTTVSVSVDRGVPLVMFSDNLEGVGINRMPVSGRALDVTGAIYSDDKKVATEDITGAYAIAYSTTNPNITGSMSDMPLGALSRSSADDFEVTSNRLVIKKAGVYSINYIIATGADSYMAGSPSRIVVEEMVGGAVAKTYFNSFSPSSPWYSFQAGHLLSVGANTVVYLRARLEGSSPALRLSTCEVSVSRVR